MRKSFATRQELSSATGSQLGGHDSLGLMMERRWGMLVSVLLLGNILGCPDLGAQGKREESVARLNKLVSERLITTRCPSLSVVVAVRNEIVFSSAQGMADLEQRVPLKN